MVTRLLEYQSAWGRPIAHWVAPFGEHRKAHFEEVRRRFDERFGPERARRICETSRNLGIFPNLVINDIMAITVRTFYPVSPDYMEVNAWALAPADESAEDSALRLDNFLTFLGPGGFATPDDVEMLESCQRGFANREVGWSDISRGMKREHPSITDELQMRAFWRRWNQLMTEPQIRAREESSMSTRTAQPSGGRGSSIQGSRAARRMAARRMARAADRRRDLSDPAD